MNDEEFFEKIARILEADSDDGHRRHGIVKSMKTKNRVTKRPFAKQAVKARQRLIFDLLLLERHESQAPINPELNIEAELASCLRLLGGIASEW